MSSLGPTVGARTCTTCGCFAGSTISTKRGSSLGCGTRTVWASSRDDLKLRAINPVQAGIDPAWEAEFALMAGNISETEETRDYYLRVKSGTNPFGATITIQGSPWTNTPVRLSRFCTQTGYRCEWPGTRKSASCERGIRGRRIP